MTTNAELIHLLKTRKGKPLLPVITSEDVIPVQAVKADIIDILSQRPANEKAPWDIILSDNQWIRLEVQG